MSALLVIGAALVLAAAFAALWWRAQRREAARESHDQRPLTPPPSPYQPSKGFRLVEGQNPPAPLERPTPPRPRLDAREYVFGDASVSVDDGVAAARHDSRWALERMTRHRRRKWRSRQWMRLGVVILLVVLAAGYALQRGPRAGTSTTTTTTSTPWPTHFVATATGSHSARVAVPSSHYSLKVVAHSTVSLELSGPSRTYVHVTLASGQSSVRSIDGTVTLRVNALAVNVQLNGSPVSLPAGASAPYSITVSAAT